MGAKADTERYCLAFDARYVHNAPWPPMLWPKIDMRVISYDPIQLEWRETNAGVHDG